MSEETVTVVPEFDDSAIVSAIEHLQSQISEAESVRESESIAAESVRVSESIAAESVRVSERAEVIEHHGSDDLMNVSLGFMLVVSLGFISGLILSHLLKRR